MSSVDRIATYQRPFLQSVFLMQYQSGPSGRHFLDSPSSNSLCADCREEKPRLRQKRAEATKLRSKAKTDPGLLLPSVFGIENFCFQADNNVFRNYTQFL